MLCIFTWMMGAPSETFIFHHFQRIAPQQTVGAYVDGTPTIWGVSCPVLQLSPLRRARMPLVVRRSLGAWNLFAGGYSDPLDRAEEERLGHFLRGHGVSVMLAEYGTNACAVRRACERLEMPLVAHFHGWDASHALRLFRYRYAYRRLLRDLAGVICPSEYLAGRLRHIGFPDRTLHVVPYGIDTRRFDGPHEPRTATLLSVGRFVEKKAPHRTIEAFAQIASRHPSARLEMVGEGPLLAACRSLAVARGVADRVIFHGSRDHGFVRAAMARAGLFLQHSVTAPNGDTEGLPVAILEAMASGLPIVATRHAGIPEAVLEGENGYLVPEHDVQGMADAIDAILSSEPLQQRMGRSSRNRAVSHFSAESQVIRLREILGIAGEAAAPLRCPHFIGNPVTDRARGGHER